MTILSVLDPDILAEVAPLPNGWTALAQGPSGLWHKHGSSWDQRTGWNHYVAARLAADRAILVRTFSDGMVVVHADSDNPHIGKPTSHI